MPLEVGQTNTPDHTAAHGVIEVLRMNNRAAIGYTRIIRNFDLAGIGIQFDFAEADNITWRLTLTWNLILGDAN